jgi:tetratricopeptide (TPR) repeat protein
MDLLDFNAEEMYFDEAVTPRVDALIVEAAEHYGAGPDDPKAELCLLRAYFLEPEHLTVLVALYRYFYYRHQYREALVIANRAIVITASRLGLPTHWRDITEADLGRSVLVSMTLTRFLLMALKGAGYLLLRLDDPAAALARFEKIAEIDTSDRLGIKELTALARGAVAEAAVQRLGGNVRYLTP